MLPLIKHSIQITIVDDSRREECEAACGIDWSSPEALTLAKQRIKDRFSAKIQIKYIDLLRITNNHDTLEWNEATKNQNLSLPLLLINGQPRISGQFDIHQLLNVIDTEIEIGAQ